MYSFRLIVAIHIELLHHKFQMHFYNVHAHSINDAHIFFSCTLPLFSCITTEKHKFTCQNERMNASEQIIVSFKMISSRIRLKQHASKC